MASYLMMSIIFFPLVYLTEKPFNTDSGKPNIKYFEKKILGFFLTLSFLSMYEDITDTSFKMIFSNDYVNIL